MTLSRQVSIKSSFFWYLNQLGDLWESNKLSWLDNSANLLDKIDYWTLNWWSYDSPSHKSCSDNSHINSLTVTRIVSKHWQWIHNRFIINSKAIRISYKDTLDSTIYVMQCIIDIVSTMARGIFTTKWWTSFAEIYRLPLPKTVALSIIEGSFLENSWQPLGIALTAAKLTSSASMLIVVRQF